MCWNVYALIHPLCRHFKMGVTSLKSTSKFLLFLCVTVTTVCVCVCVCVSLSHKTSSVYRNHGNAVLEPLVTMQPECDVTANHGNEV